MLFIKENFDSYPHYFVNGAKREYGYYLKIKGEFSDLLNQLSKEDYDFFEYDENVSKKVKVPFNDEKQFEKIINNGNETKIMTYNDYREKLDIFKNNVKSVKI